MNIFGHLTRKTMKQNKVRTLVSIIGVILSTAMFTAVTTFVSSMMNFGLETYTYKNGDWHIRIFNQSEEKLQKILDDKQVEKYGTSERIGFAKINSQNEEKPYLYIEAEDEGALSILPIHMINGRLPENENEIILPEHLSSNGGVSIKLNDTLRLVLGDRFWEGEPISGNGVYVEEETLTERFSKEYTVTGFYERPEFESYSASGYTALTCMGEETYDSKVMSVRVKIKNSEFKLKDFIKAYDLSSDIEQNWDVLMFSGIFQYGNIASFVFFMGGIVVLIIMLGSISMIYSVFSISVSERTKQFGLLSSIGATKRQIKHCVFSEAATVLIIGVPVGILSGILGMGITFTLVGDKFKNILSSPYGMRLHISIPALIIAAVIASITVFLSAFVPSRRATRVTAMEAIRQSKEIIDKKQKFKIPGFVYKLFGLEGVLANKYFKRSKRKYRTTVISLTLSIVLFVATSVFCSGLSNSVEDSFQVKDFDIYYDSGLTKTDEIELLDERIAGIPGIKRVARNSSVASVVYNFENFTTKEYQDYMMEMFNQGTSENSEIEESSTVFGVYYLAKDVYEKLAVENGISKTEAASTNPPALVLNDISYVQYTKKGKGYDRVVHKLPVMKDGIDELPLSFLSVTGEGNQVEAHRDTKNVKIGAILQKAPFGVISMGYEGALLLLPETSKLSSLGGTEQYYFEVSDYEKMISSFREMLSQNGYATEEWRLLDVKEREKDNRDLILLVNVFTYGFIVLLSLISVANVFNTISTNIALRRKDFGMLRSIGMSNRGLRKMMNYECLLYGSRSLIFGIPISIGAAYWIYTGTRSAVDQDFHLPFIPLLIAAVSVFAVVFITMLYSMNKIKKDNPLEALRSESV